MDLLLRYARQKQGEIVALIKEFVECESPSDHPASVNRFTDLLAERVKNLARVRTYARGNGCGKHMRCEFALRGARKRGQILALGHSDTVWPLGTLAAMPFRQAEGRLWGPGVFDMKGGLAFFIFAMRALWELEVPVARNVILQVNSDEEIGSPSSRALTEDAAREIYGADGLREAFSEAVTSTSLAGRAKAAHPPASLRPVQTAFAAS